MGIQNFPASLQPIIQQGFLEREFSQALRSRLGYRACADRVNVAVGIGETLTKTRAGLKPSVTTPLAPSTNTNFDNGLTPTTWGVEQYTVSINLYAATTDLNVVTERVGIASQFLQNAYINGEQSARSLDELSRNALFAAYLGGNTRVRTTLASAAPAVAVDDIRGFQMAFVNGIQQAVSNSNPMTVTIGANVYSVVGAAIDTTNVSTAPNGVSGVLTLSGNVSVSDGAAGNTVTAAIGSTIVRPSQRGNTSLITASDTLTMSNLLDAVAKLRMNAVPEIDGAYNCYLDPVSARQLFADPDFKQLFQGATSANQVFKKGMTNDFLGLRFVPTTEAFVQAHPTLSSLMIRRPIICGQGALIEGDFAGMAASDITQATTSAMRRAFNALKNGRPGPVMVEVPRDLVDLDAGNDAESYRAIVPTISMPNAQDVDAAAKMLLAASSPMILAGQGVLYAQASDELTELAALLQAPVMTTVDGKSAFPEDHPLALGSGGNTFNGPGRMFLHTRTDLIFGIGCGFTKHPLTTPTLPPNVPIIHATNDSRDLHKSYQTEVALLGDARLTLISLIGAVKDRLGGKLLNRSPAADLAAERNAWMARWDAKLNSPETPMTPYRVMSEFIRVVDPAEAIVTHDSGSPRDQLLPFYKATRPRGYLGWGKSHQLGTGLGLIIGAKVAAPDKFCVNFMGDAAFGMTGLDLETAVRAGIPSLTIVLNNSTMAIEIPHMKLSHEKHQARDLGGRYADLGRDLGAWSERVSDPNDIANAILRAKGATEDGKTALLEFMTSAETAFSHRNGGPV